MSNSLCSKRRIKSCSKRAILDSSSSEDEKTSLDLSRNQREQIQKAPVVFSSIAVRRQPVSIAKKTPEQRSFTLTSTSSSDDDDSLLKPVVVTNRRSAPDTLSFSLQKAEQLPTPQDSSLAVDDSSVDTIELKRLLLIPTPKRITFDLANKQSPTASSITAAHLKPSPQNHLERRSIQENDDSSENTEALTRFLLKKNTSPDRMQSQANTDKASSISDPKLPTEIETLGPRGIDHPAPENFDSDEFELPDAEESSDSSVASQTSTNVENYKLPKRKQAMYENCKDHLRVQNGIPHSAGLSCEAETLIQARPVLLDRLKQPVYPTSDDGHLCGGGGPMGIDPQQRKEPPNPAQLHLRELRDAAFFDVPIIDLSHSDLSSQTTKRRKYSSNSFSLDKETKVSSENHNSQILQLERAAFFDDSSCNRQAETTPAHVRIGLHSPRATPFSQMPLATSNERDRGDCIQDFSDEDTAVQRFGRLASHALEQKRQSLLQTAQPQQTRNVTEPSNHVRLPRRCLRDVSMCDTAMSRAVVLRKSGGDQFDSVLPQRNDVVGGSGVGWTGFSFTPAPPERTKVIGQGKRNATINNKRRSGGWKGRSKWSKSKGTKKGGAASRGRGTKGTNNIGRQTTTSSSGAFSRGDDAKLRHIGGAEFSF